MFFSGRSFSLARFGILYCFISLFFYSVCISKFNDFLMSLLNVLLNNFLLEPPLLPLNNNRWLLTLEVGLKIFRLLLGLSLVTIVLYLRTFLSFISLELLHVVGLPRLAPRFIEIFCEL